MAVSSQAKDLIQLETGGAANKAPEREPEVWDERIPAFNPRFGRTPENPPVAVSPELDREAAEGRFDVADYLAEERAKDLLRFSTAGSVDDGKSTLIGRLLYDMQSVYDDQIQSIEGKGTTAPGVLDLALLTDGLRAEREQGITIDVAYRYFSTARRKFIIADTPGHEQYTRNMATGASTADAAIVLVDARNGVLTQSRRHAYITALLGVRHVIVAVNKMDLVSYSEADFRRIQSEFSAFFASLEVDGHESTELHFLPVSALAGDNVVHKTGRMPWYTGPSLLELLEFLPSAAASTAAPFRLAVQRVIRPNLDFRGFAGQIASGSVRPGDQIVVLPSGQTSRVERIVTFDGDLAEAAAPLSVTLTLTDEIDISRGDLLTTRDTPADVTSAFTASLVWMDATPLDLTRRYLLKHTSRTVQGQVRRLLHTVDLADLQRKTESDEALAMNDIGLVEVEALLPLAVDPYSFNRRTGSFVLIDGQSNATVAAGMIRRTTIASEADRIGEDAAESFGRLGAVSATERLARNGHTGAHLALDGPLDLGEAVERALFESGVHVVLLCTQYEAAIPELTDAGLVVVTVNSAVAKDSFTAGISGTKAHVVLRRQDGLAENVRATLQMLRDARVLREEERL